MGTVQEETKTIQTQKSRVLQNRVVMGNVNTLWFGAVGEGAWLAVGASSVPLLDTL